ncbi:MAG TPA: DUF885 family protein [Saprospiraceae bacterium]|nr:DUF885 family protein [Saprospiraceae bacterium]HMP15348.1 DUF885 family protein [Saprospiraceae bacterium]
MKKLCAHTLLWCLVVTGLVAQEVPDSKYFYSEVSGLLTQYTADRQALLRLHIADNAPERTQRLLSLDESYLKQLKSLKFNTLSKAGQVDYILFKRDLEQGMTEAREASETYKNQERLLPFAERLYQLEREHRRGKPADGATSAQLFDAISNEIKDLKASDITKNVPADDVRFLQTTLQGIKKTTEKYYNFYYGYDPLFSWWVQKPYEKLITDLDSYAKWLNTHADTTGQMPTDKSGIVGTPIGKSNIIRSLQYEMISYTPEELIAIAEKEFEWCRREMLRASRDMGFGDRWKDAMEKVKNTYVPPGQQPQVIHRLYNESIAFIKKHNLVSIPPLAEEVWRMGMMSPERQLVSPFFLGGEQIIISYPTHTMEHQDKLMSMRGNNPHFSRATVHHELIAGHHLQQFMNRRYRSYRNFNTAFWTEGWALYWEMILWDLNFPESPEDRVGMLFWRMHRCARIIFSLNYHLGNWTPQQCIDFLVDEVNHERANAAAEVRRSFEGRYNPLYQVAYMIGGLQFRALKEELVDRKKMTYQQFHDAILKENNMPVEMVRAILTDARLHDNYQTTWRFYKL